MKLLKLEFQRGGRDRVVLHFDKGEPLGLALIIVERRRLGVGDEIDLKTLRALEEDDRKWLVRQAALNLLSYRARGRTELGQRLRKKGHAPALVLQCLDTLEEQGLVDDTAFASGFTRGRLTQRPRGSRRIVQELRAKGIHTEVAQDAVQRVMEDEEVTDITLAGNAAAAWVKRQGEETLAALSLTAPREARQRARRRLTGFLARRGFTSDALAHGIETALKLANAPAGVISV